MNTNGDSLQDSRAPSSRFSVHCGGLEIVEWDRRGAIVRRLTGHVHDERTSAWHQIADTPPIRMSMAWW
jgi:hypothetical protein